MLRPRSLPWRRPEPLALALVALMGCARSDPLPAPAASASTTSTAPAATASATTAASAPTAPSASAATPPPPASITLVAGGDVSFGRMRGQRLLRDPKRDDFAALAPLLATGDLRFVNLECPVTDQNGRTVSPINKLVFTGPPETAAALVRGRIDIVSLANNHAWDYGQKGLLETLDRLDAAGVKVVGAGRDRARAYAPVVVDVRGFRVAFVAVTATWNQAMNPHPGWEHVADAKKETLVASVREARKKADAVVVSHHGGYEYVGMPHEGTRALLRAAIDAGADAVIGHHPHVIQRAAFKDGRPILYSLGNMLMRMKTGEPATEIGLLARVRLHRGKPPELEVCPFRQHGLEQVPLAADPKRRLYEAQFTFQFGSKLRAGARQEPSAAGRLGAFRPDGCAPVVPAPGT